MKIEIHGTFKPVQSGDFRYSNRDSRYGVNTQYFTKDAVPFLIIAGEFHFSRCPRARWKSTLLKMRSCGINAVSTYVFWNYHEEHKGKFDFSGDKDISAFLGICREIQMPCILRIGPWCHGEVVCGGFPKRIQRMPGKRSDNPRYLRAVRDFWQGLYGEIAPFLDGETIIGLQLENEYTGKTEHIRTLRTIAEEIGYRVPFFTMTAWPSARPDPEFLPMMGGYPDAPWTMGKKALKAKNRFAITPAKTQDEIGADLHRNNCTHASNFDDIPYAFCEIGPGNQVTQHRRPVISEKDGYGVGFAKLASGANWLGYYMFCGGRNPNDRLLQESRLTGYPNNYPIIDYDFQAPISRYGECRAHGDRLRLLHLFTQHFDPLLCTKQTFFPKWSSNDPMDISFLKCSVRMGQDGSGYFFAGTYEKGLQYRTFQDVQVQVRIDNMQRVLPRLDIPPDAMFFYPFHLTLGSFFFDWILAQPIAKTELEGEMVCYFAAIEGVPPRCRLSGREIFLQTGIQGNLIEEGDQKLRLIVLEEKQAKQFHFVGGKAYFLPGTVYTDGEMLYCEQLSALYLKEKLVLKPCGRKALAYGYFLYSVGRRGYYALELPWDILENRFDVKLTFAFEGLNLQVFSGKTLINDFFNIDGKFELYLRDYAEWISKSPVLTIRVASKTKYGVSHVYHEAPIPLNSVALRLESVQEVKLSKRKIL